MLITKIARAHTSDNRRIRYVVIHGRPGDLPAFELLGDHELAQQIFAAEGEVTILFKDVLITLYGEHIEVLSGCAAVKLEGSVKSVLRDVHWHQRARGTDLILGRRLHLGAVTRRAGSSWRWHADARGLTRMSAASAQGICGTAEDAEDAVLQAIGLMLKEGTEVSTETLKKGFARREREARAICGYKQ